MGVCFIGERGKFSDFVGESSASVSAVSRADGSSIRLNSDHGVVHHT